MIYLPNVYENNDWICAECGRETRYSYEGYCYQCADGKPLCKEIKFVDCIQKK